MGKPPVGLLARDRCERCGDGLLQGFQRSGCLCPQECLDLGPTVCDWGQVGRIRREREPPDAHGGTGIRDARHLRGCEIIQDEALTWLELWHQPLLQKGQTDLAVGASFAWHGRDQPLETQGAEHGDMAAPLDGLSGQGPLAPRRTGIKAGHRLLATRCVQTNQVFRGEWLDGSLPCGPLPLALWARVLGGAQRLFCGVGPVW
jgi:hypothetical protein